MCGTVPVHEVAENSIIVTARTVALVLFVSLPAGYAFARLGSKGKQLLFNHGSIDDHDPFVAYYPQLYLLMPLFGSSQ